jgi:hypothetical protein
MSADDDKILRERKLIRRIERKMRRERRNQMSLESELLSKVPSGLIPGNVGAYNDIAWKFTYSVDFNFGVNPTYDQNTNQTQSYQNTQEAAFIFGWISRSAADNTTASNRAPLQLRIVDRQSTRQFNDLPIPLQMIPESTPPMALEVPLIIMPMAFMDLTMTSWLTAAQATVGSGKHSIAMGGYRVRTNDIGKVLSMIFGG